MYPGHKELIIDNPESVSERHRYTEGNDDGVMSRLDFTVNIICQEVSRPTLLNVFILITRKKNSNRYLTNIASY